MSQQIDTCVVYAEFTRWKPRGCFQFLFDLIFGGTGTPMYTYVCKVNDQLVYRTPELTYVNGSQGLEDLYKKLLSAGWTPQGALMQDSEMNLSSLKAYHKYAKKMYFTRPVSTE